MSINAEEIINKLIESIEEKNYFHGEKMERLEKEHREDIKEKNEKIRNFEYKITSLETRLNGFTWSDLTQEEKQNAMNHFIQCFEEAMGENLTEEQKNNIQERINT